MLYIYFINILLFSTVQIKEPNKTIDYQCASMMSKDIGTKIYSKNF